MYNELSEFTTWGILRAQISDCILPVADMPAAGQCLRRKPFCPGLGKQS